MTTRVDAEEISASRSEKVLAVVLTVFILIGSVWLYVKIDTWTGANGATYSSSQQAILDESDAAWTAAADAGSRRDEALDELNLARDELTLAIDRGEDTTEADQRYKTALADYNELKQRADSAQEKADAAEAKAEAVRAESSRSTWRDLLSLGLRLLLVLVMLLGSLRLIAHLRARESRWLPAGFSAVGAATIMAVVFAFDTIFSYIDVADLGPVVLSLIGIGATLAAFAALQRYLARRIPRSRVRKGECPFCGFPAHRENTHCEGCGRGIIATCASCGMPRRVGTPYCAHCGAS